MCKHSTDNYLQEITGKYAVPFSLQREHRDRSPPIYTNNVKP